MSVLLAIAIAALITFLSPRVYAAQSSAIVTLPGAATPSELALADSLAKSRATSYVDVAKGREVAQRVIDDLHLATSAESLVQRITVSQPIDTVSLRIRATAGTPGDAQRLADSWVKALSAQISEIENPDHAVKDVLRLRVTESAALPTSPVSPNPVRNLLFGALIGLLAGGGYAVVRSRLDRRIRDIETVARDFGVTVAGAIPTSSSLQRSSGELVPIVVNSGRRSRERGHAAESILKIRTNLQFMDIDNPPRVIVVTSPMPGDGKSTVSANLAVALAEAGNPVVLLDGDLRRPVVAEAFGLVDGAGLTDVLTGRAAFDDVVQQPADYPQLGIVSAGSTPPNPSELLGSKAMSQFLHGLRQEHVVIVDAPPLLPVTDAAVLTANADGALVVISAGKTLDTQLDAALSHLEAVNGHVLGVIFNKVAPNGTGTHYGYYGGYGYYYGEDRTKTTVQAVRGDSITPASTAEKHDAASLA